MDTFEYNGHLIIPEVSRHERLPKVRNVCVTKKGDVRVVIVPSTTKDELIKYLENIELDSTGPVKKNDLLNETFTPVSVNRAITPPKPVINESPKKDNAMHKSNVVFQHKPKVSTLHYNDLCIKALHTNGNSDGYRVWDINPTPDKIVWLNCLYGVSDDEIISYVISHFQQIKRIISIKQARPKKDGVFHIDRGERKKAKSITKSKPKIYCTTPRQHSKFYEADSEIRPKQTIDLNNSDYYNRRRDNTETPSERAVNADHGVRLQRHNKIHSSPHNSRINLANKTAIELNAGSLKFINGRIVDSETIDFREQD